MDKHSVLYCIAFLPVTLKNNWEKAFAGETLENYRTDLLHIILIHVQYCPIMLQFDLDFPLR